MMKRIIFLFLLLGIKPVVGQNVVGVSYTYLYSPYLDRCIQTYNFDRPYLPNKQPLLKHGFSIALQHHLKNNKRSIAFDYSRFTSKVVNENFSNKLSYNAFNLEYIFELEKQLMKERLSFQLGTGISILQLNNKKNNQNNYINDIFYSSLGGGVNLSFLMNYKVIISKDKLVLPFVMFTTSPFIYSPYFEGIINGTKSLVKGQNLFTSSLKLGIRLQF